MGDQALEQQLLSMLNSMTPEQLANVAGKAKPLRAPKAKSQGTWGDPGVCKEHIEVRKVIKCKHCGSEWDKICTLTKAEATPVIKASGDVAWVTYDAEGKHAVVCTSYVSWCTECVQMVKSWTHEELITKYLQMLQEKPKRDARAFVVRPGRR